MDSSSYYNELMKWRTDYEARLAAPDGWLSISGLYWLKDGANQVGADSKNEIVLPAYASPAQAGVITCQENQISVEAAEGVEITLDGQPVRSKVVKLNQYASSDWFFLGDVKFAVIQRGVRFGVRVYDKNNPARLQFVTLRWFPIDEAFCIQANWFLNEKPMEIPITNVLGDTSPEPCPGYAEFTLYQQTHRLYPVVSSEGDRLWFMFRDNTNGNMTYAGGRFLWANAPQNGRVTLDFNKAYNPPCAYTDFATCPLPPEMNHLTAPLMAGEMKFK